MRFAVVFNFLPIHFALILPGVNQPHLRLNRAASLNLRQYPNNTGDRWKTPR